MQAPRDGGTREGWLRCRGWGSIVASRPYSPRDTFQMKDVTRGPSMHNEQFEGLTWASVPLFDQVHVWLLGASDAASEVAALADHVGFAVTVVDYDQFDYLCALYWIWNT